ncbi:hypothetical protein BDF21DRAFT_449998 [Thamnidium elegans]|nr:hypothetical protein BDF21DRAFT_449998 [Thamnidium elegans]
MRLLEVTKATGFLLIKKVDYLFVEKVKISNCDAIVAAIMINLLLLAALHLLSLSFTVDSLILRALQLLRSPLLRILLSSRALFLKLRALFQV